MRHKSGPKKRLLNLINEPDRIECLIDPTVAPLKYKTEDFDLVDNRNNRIVGEFRPVEISTLISREATGSLRAYSSEQGKYECQRINSETSVSVREWVERNDAKQMRNPTLISILDSGVVEPKHRRELVRVVCTELIKLNESMYPPTSLKKHVAKEIIKAFPKLRSTHPGGEGHEHFYDAKNNHGFIEFRLKTLRVSLSPSKKKRASPSAAKNSKGKKGLPVPRANNDCLNEKDFDEKVLELSMKIPSHTNTDEIFRLTDETRPNRQKEIRDSETSLRVSVDDILQKYPRFKDFCGELIHREFVAEFPGNDKFLTNFVSFYVPRILKYCSSTRPELLESAKDIHDDNLKALILIPELLPIPNFTKRMKLHKKSEDGKRKGKVKSKGAAQCNFSAKIIPNERLLQYVNPAHDFLLENSPTVKELENVQPFLVCCMTGGEKKGVFYIKTNEHLIEIGSDGMTAFDILLKLHYCFNVQFAADLIYFYDFITSCVLQFSSPKACCSALNTTLQNISLSDTSFPNNNTGDLSISESEAEVLSENDNL